MEQNIFLVTGLGNAGREYARTFHNMGFLALDRLSDRLRIPTDRLRFKGVCGLGRVGDGQVLLLKPATYMNLSGESIREAAAFYKIPPEQILVLYDDIDIEIGRIRIREQGGPGSHNGMKSVIARLGSEQFPRIRIGIGPLPEHWDIVKYVLSAVPEDRQAALDQALERAAEAAETCVREGVMKAMNRFNTRL